MKHYLIFGILLINYYFELVNTFQCIDVTVNPRSGSTLVTQSEYRFDIYFSDDVYILLDGTALLLKQATDEQLSAWYYLARRRIVSLRSLSNSYPPDDLAPISNMNGMTLIYSTLPSPSDSLYLFIEGGVICLDPYCQEWLPAQSPAWYYIASNPAVQDPCPSYPGETSQSNSTCRDTMGELSPKMKNITLGWQNIPLMPSVQSMRLADCPDVQNQTSPCQGGWQLKIHLEFPSSGSEYLLDLTGMPITDSDGLIYFLEDQSLSQLRLVKPDSQIVVPVASKNQTVTGKTEYSLSWNGALPDATLWEGTVEPSDRETFLGYWGNSAAYTYQCNPSSVTESSSISEIESNPNVTIHVRSAGTLVISFYWNSTVAASGSASGWQKIEGPSRGFACSHCAARNANCRACDWGIHRLVEQSSPDQMLRVFQLGTPVQQHNLEVSQSLSATQLTMDVTENNLVDPALLDAFQQNVLLIPRIPKYSAGNLPQSNVSYDAWWSTLLSLPDPQSYWLWVPKSRIGDQPGQLGVSWAAWVDSQSSQCQSMLGEGSRGSEISNETYATYPLGFTAAIDAATATDVLQSGGDLVPRIQLASGWETLLLTLEGQPWAVDLQWFNKLSETRAANTAGLKFKEPEVSVQMIPGAQECLSRISYTSSESAQVSVYMRNIGRLGGSFLMTSVTCDDPMALPGFNSVLRIRDLQVQEGIFEALTVVLSSTSSNNPPKGNSTIVCYISAQVSTQQKYWSDQNKNDTCQFTLQLKDGNFVGNTGSDSCKASKVPVPKALINNPALDEIDEVYSSGRLNITVTTFPDTYHNAAVGFPLVNAGTVAGDFQSSLTCDAQITILSNTRVDSLNLAPQQQTRVEFKLQVASDNATQGLFYCGLNIVGTRTTNCFNLHSTQADRWVIPVWNGHIIPYVTWTQLNPGSPGANHSNGNHSDTPGPSDGNQTCTNPPCSGEDSDGFQEFLNTLFHGYTETTQLMLFLLMIAAIILGLVFFIKMGFILAKHRKKRHARKQKLMLKQLQANLFLPHDEWDSDDEEYILDQANNNLIFHDGYQPNLSALDTQFTPSITQFSVQDWTGQVRSLMEAEEWPRMYITGYAMGEPFERCMADVQLLRYDDQQHKLYAYFQDGTVYNLEQPRAHYRDMAKAVTQQLHRHRQKPATCDWAPLRPTPKVEEEPVVVKVAEPVAGASEEQPKKKDEVRKKESKKKKKWTKPKLADYDMLDEETESHYSERSYRGDGGAEAYHLHPHPHSKERDIDREIIDGDFSDEDSDWHSSDSFDDSDQDSNSKSSDRLQLLPKQSPAGRKRWPRQRLGFGASPSRFQSHDEIKETRREAQKIPQMRSASSLPMALQEMEPSRYLAVSPRKTHSKSRSRSRSRSRSPKKQPELPGSPSHWPPASPMSRNPSPSLKKKGVSLSNRRFEIGFHINT